MKKAKYGAQKTELVRGSKRKSGKKRQINRPTVSA